MKTLLRAASLITAIVAIASPIQAQWAGVKTPGVPRNADGQPNLTAPAPKTADGKPDFSGVWQNGRGGGGGGGGGQRGAGHPAPLRLRPPPLHLQLPLPLLPALLLRHSQTPGRVSREVFRTNRGLPSLWRSARRITAKTIPMRIAFPWDSCSFTPTRSLGRSTRPPTHS